jgi:hypothetical protein
MFVFGGFSLQEANDLRNELSRELDVRESTEICPRTGAPLQEVETLCDWKPSSDAIWRLQRMNVRTKLNNKLFKQIQFHRPFKTRHLRR